MVTVGFFRTGFLTVGLLFAITFAFATSLLLALLLAALGLLRALFAALGLLAVIDLVAFLVEGTGGFFTAGESVTFFSSSILSLRVVT